MFKIQFGMAWVFLFAFITGFDKRMWSCGSNIMIIIIYLYQIVGKFLKILVHGNKYFSKVYRTVHELGI